MAAQLHFSVRCYRKKEKKHSKIVMLKKMCLLCLEDLLQDLLCGVVLSQEMRIRKSGRKHLKEKRESLSCFSWINEIKKCKFRHKNDLNLWCEHSDCTEALQNIRQR
jgi:dynactin complex subunit